MRKNQRKLKPEEQANIVLDKLRGVTNKKLAQKYGISADTVSTYLNENIDFVNAAKQALISKCTEDAIRFGHYITPRKLQKASAHQLVTMRRESVYTAEMLRQGTANLEGSGASNLVQIILQAQQIQQQQQGAAAPVQQAPQDPEPVDAEVVEESANYEPEPVRPRKTARKGAKKTPKKRGKC